LPDKSGQGRPGWLLGLALALGLLTAAAGLAAIALIPGSTPDAAYKARVQAWRDMPPTPRPAQP
jgi:hypothetical protein